MNEKKLYQEGYCSKCGELINGRPAEFLSDKHGRVFLAHEECPNEE